MADYTINVLSNDITVDIQTNDITVDTSPANYTIDITQPAYTVDVVSTDVTVDVQGAIMNIPYDHSALTNKEWSKAGHTIDTNLNFGNNDATNLSKIEFNTSYSQNGESIGSLFWNTVNDTLTLKTTNETNLDIGQETRFYGKASENISNGQVVQFNGAQGDHVLFKVANTSEVIANPKLLMGIATEDINKGSFGNVTKTGYVTMNTTGWSQNDLLWWDNNTGQLTNVEPNAPNRVVLIGVVIKEETSIPASNGIILVRPTWMCKVTELEDVDGTPLTTDGQILVWNQSNSYFDPNYNITDYLKLDASNDPITGDLSINANLAIYEQTDPDATNNVGAVIYGTFPGAGFGNPLKIQVLSNGDARLLTTQDLIVDCGTNKTLELNETVWTDMRTPVNAIRLGGAQPPSEQPYRSSVVLAFPDNVDKTIFFTVQLPHEYKLGSDIEFHIHGILPTAGGGAGAENLKFDFTYSWADIGDPMPVETPVPKTIDVQNYDADTHYLFEIAETIDGSAISGVSSMLLCSLTRDTGVANNYGDDFYLIEVDFHYQKDTMGSRQESVK